MRTLFCSLVLAGARLAAAELFLADPRQGLERTCFQTAGAYAPAVNLRSDVAIVYGVDQGLPDRIASWRERGYRIHVMTGVSWGNYQDYLYGRFDGVNHEDEAQTERSGRKISHGGDVYYMCPGENFGRFLSVGVQRALDAGAEAIHLEEPEFWVRAGYSEGFKRAWRRAFNQDWQPPHTSADAQWRASRLKYDLYRYALQQVFDHVQAFNRRTGRQVRCYVPTHSLLNYAHWRIVSPESSLAQLDGCDGYIAQVWTGTARTPNRYRGVRRERTFETAFLEYGAMQNLVRATGRRVWYLNDPIEDNPNHDWSDYRTNWQATLVAALFQPEVSRYEVMPWPQRVFGGRYPSATNRQERVPIPGPYATELLSVINTLNDLDQRPVVWEGGNPALGLVVGDSLMFQRGDPEPGDPDLGHVYGLALPLLKRGIIVEPVQLENVGLPHYLDRHRVLLMTYRGMKPLTPAVHTALATWVRRGGVLGFCDDDADPYCRVREWWNQGPNGYATPREHLFEQLGLTRPAPGVQRAGRGWVVHLRWDPAALANAADGDQQLLRGLEPALRRAGIRLEERNYLLLRRGDYRIAAGLDESVDAPPKRLEGRFVDLFDPELPVRRSVLLTPGSRWFLRDLEATGRAGPVLAAACKTRVVEDSRRRLAVEVEGVADTRAVVLVAAGRPPRQVTLDGAAVEDITHDPREGLLWVRFPNAAWRRELRVEFR